MENCCNNELGRFPHNEDINTGIKAVQNGYHVLRFMAPNFTWFTLTYYYFANADIIIPKGKLNESFLYTMKILQPDDTYLETDDCDNYTFTTFINTKACGTCDDEEIFIYE